MFRRFIAQRLNSQESSADEQPPPLIPPPASPAVSTQSTGSNGTASLFSSIASNFAGGGSTPNNSKGKSLEDATASFAEKNQQKIDENTKKVYHLSTFDGCIEACDALASSATPSGRVDPSTGLPDCSVLISADGDLLLIPQEQQAKTKDMGKESAHSADSTASSMYAPSIKELLLTDEEYESAIFRGIDLLPTGDKALNGFSAQGWSFPASSLAMKQNEYAISDLVDFVEDLVLTKKESAAKEAIAVEKLRILVDPDPSSKSIPRKRRKQFEKFLKSTFPEQQLELKPTRVGPLNFAGGTVHATVVALEEYYSKVNHAESSRWTSCQQQSGPIGKLKRSLMQAEQRSSNRQKALQEMFQRSKAMEEQLKQCKEDARKRWDAVHEAEEAVTKFIETKMLERSRLKEKQRLEQLKEEEMLRAHDSATGNFGATQNEIWDIVSSVAASMEEGSFEPMDLPQAPLSLPRDQTKLDKRYLSSSSDGVDKGAEEDLAAAPIAPRHELEDEFGLPELRVAALAADEAVEEAGKALLTVLSNIDATKRSARIAAETGLVSACNAQASCLRSLVNMERKALQERLQHLDELERVAECIDVRADMNHYITIDKKEEGGRSTLGDDDDGGVASALGVLSSHIDGDIGFGSNPLRQQDSDRDWDDDDSASPEILGDGVEELFKDNPLLRSDAPAEDDKTVKAREKFEKTVEMLCKTGNDRSSAGRSPRSTICYALNAKRSSNTRILTPIQFDGICGVFEALLNGCKTENDSGVSIAKMCMMLSQTFYLDESKPIGNEDDADDENDESRENRVYVKSRLHNHPLWQNDSFWDQALYSCVSESLTHSGVLSNFEENYNRTVGAQAKKKMEWMESHKMRWHDMCESDRVEAASQVHAVVFAQLSALGHSMIEFGCSLQRSCAFVRRMAVKNQLPASQRTMLVQHLLARHGTD